MSYISDTFSPALPLSLSLSISHHRKRRLRVPLTSKIPREVLKSGSCLVVLLPSPRTDLTPYLRLISCGDSMALLISKSSSLPVALLALSRICMRSRMAHNVCTSRVAQSIHERHTYMRAVTIREVREGEKI